MEELPPGSRTCDFLESREPMEMPLRMSCPPPNGCPRKRKDVPSGRKTGQRWVPSPREASNSVTGVGTPPEADTRWIGSRLGGAEEITPAGLPPPARPVGAP